MLFKTPDKLTVFGFRTHIAKDRTKHWCSAEGPFTRAFFPPRSDVRGVTYKQQISMVTNKNNPSAVEVGPRAEGGTQIDVEPGLDACRHGEG